MHVTFERKVVLARVFAASYSGLYLYLIIGKPISFSDFFLFLLFFSFLRPESESQHKISTTVDRTGRSTGLELY